MLIDIFMSEWKGHMGEPCQHHPHPVRTLSKPVPPPWLRDRVLAEVYAIERRRRRLIAATRYGAIAIAVLLGSGIIYLGWMITR